MKKTSNFFVIHNFNTIPTNLLDMCEDYIIYDCSTDQEVKDKLHSMNLNIKDIPNTGHNITSYFSYFAENYDNIPEVICLMKGNMVGRHISQEYLEKVYDNKYFTFLYEEKKDQERFSRVDKNGNPNELGLTFLAMENIYLEKNNSWYVPSDNHPKKYFDEFDDLLRFVYKNPILPQYIMFCPGACFIVRREQVLKHSKEFYLNLNKIMNYGMNPSFPSEAHQVERMLPIIFSSQYEVNEWMNDEKAFEDKLPECSAYIKYKFENRPRRFKKLRQALGLI